MKPKLKAFLEQLFSSSDNAFLLVDSKTFHLHFISPKLVSILHLERSRSESISIFDLLPKPKDEYLAELNFALNNESILCDWEFLRSDRSLIRFNFKLSQLSDPEDNLSYLFFQISDQFLTNSDDQVKIISKENESLRRIIGTMNNGIVIVNEEGIVQDIAPIFKFLLFQFIPIEKGDFIFEFLDKDLITEYKNTLKECLSHMQVKTKHFTYRIFENDYDFDIRFIPIRRSENLQKLIMLIYTDKTEANRLDRQLVESMKFASIGEIAAGLAHEINNPLQSALLNLDELIVVGIEDPSEQKEILKKIEAANLRIRDLVLALLDLGRVESRTRDLVSPYYILVRSSELLEVSCKKKGIEFKRHAGPNLPGIVVRWQEIEQVLINCVVNAINALSEMNPPRQSPKIEIGIDLVKNNKKDWVVFSIEDNGPGMSEEVLDKAFLPLFTTRREKQGTGLGLSISKKIINDHDGDIVIKSRDGLGTKIEIYLPVQLDTYE
ncbi:GHKL domain protein [Leptospira ryugenii]|uniref:histidine kinase n=1 Tax=Leptospira ryugenii TaxID=1917863 RepID=A0A2P2E2Z9_9LEPT|nr:ATP-binding protein [Leptospira ryugenii]GBF51268.1 GHKL domain protein [Leptospira ryugenii]